MSSVSQKEYLKKYLGLGKDPREKKKRKKKDKGLGNRLKIVDEDFDASIANEIQQDISAANEDAPQIVAVIDDRPPSLRVDEETKSNLWTPIGESSKPKPELSLSNNFKLNTKKDFVKDILKSSSTQRNTSDIKSETQNSSVDGSSSSNSYRSQEKISAEQRRKIDASPQRKIKEEVLSPVRVDRDVSSNCNESPDSKYQNSGRRKVEEDISPPRRRNRQNASENDISPPRYRRRDSDSDASPPRKNRDNSPPRKNRRLVQSIESDSSPPTKYKRYDSPRDSTPPRRNRKEKEKNNTSTELRDESRKSRWNDSSETVNVKRERSEKTLSGKRAGLQDAKGITKELVALREKEDELFRSLPEELSGANAATIVRGKKPLDIEEDARQRLKNNEMKEKYDRWGKGLKQVEDRDQKLADQLHEMNKPLARYADDEDLERYLKEQEREGDPMLTYIRKKKRKKAIECGVSEKPEYMGEFMPNRFGIKPGYRWDGVDRSNGYESRWFETQNKKKAVQEESHKWSTEDM